MRPLLAFALVASGCATGGGYHHGGYYHHRHHGGGAALANLLIFGLAVAATAAEHAQPPPPPPPPPDPEPHPLPRPFVGNVRGPTGRGLGNVHVMLRGTNDVVVLETFTDPFGDFRFPLPLPPDWYRISIEEPVLGGAVRVWLNERGPGGLIIYARPLPPTAP